MMMKRRIVIKTKDYCQIQKITHVPYVRQQQPEVNDIAEIVSNILCGMCSSLAIRVYYLCRGVTLIKLSFCSFCLKKNSRIDMPINTTL